MTAIQELAAGKLDGWSEAEILVLAQEVTATEVSQPARRGALTPHHRALLRHNIVNSRALEILAEDGKLDTWTEAEYLDAIRRAQDELGINVDRRDA